MRLLVAIPAFNEEDTIEEVVADVKVNLPEAQILVINDGSTDNTRTILKSLDVLSLDFPFNMGVGAAMRAAFKFAHEENYSHVLQLDADGQHPAVEASKLIASVNEAEIVIGSRFLDLNDYEVGKVRRLAMKILASVVGRRIGKKLTDVTSGFRLTGGAAIHFYSLNYPPEYLGDTVESIMMAGQKGFKVEEVSVVMQERKGGQPSQNLYKLIVYLARVVTVIVISYLQYEKRRKTK
jgi:glycosyltransferase involved in cell wall biosynthesis